MKQPVNFDSVGVDGILQDWMFALREFAVQAVVVLGPDPFGDATARDALAVHPPSASDMARALADSSDFGAPWRDSAAPMVAWQHIANTNEAQRSRWRRIALGHGLQSVVRVEFALPASRAFECFLFSPRELSDRSEAAAIIWSTLNVWPLLREAIARERGPLSARERECLVLAFDGHTARETAQRLGCTERTVNYHLANAMAKLKVDNKLAAIQRACWIGAL